MGVGMQNLQASFERTKNARISMWKADPDFYVSVAKLFKTTTKPIELVLSISACCMLSLLVSVNILVLLV